MKILLLMLAAIIFAGCQHNAESGSVNQMHEFTQDTKVVDVIDYKNFDGFGRLIFPTRGIDKNFTLKNLDEVLIWYSEVRERKTVEIANYMREKSDAGEKIFYDIYTAEEKLSDPRKNDTGLFFFRGKPNAKFVICNAGGGFYYVGAMHDSFPHALELSKRGYNAFALIYRPDAQLACEDLARAIAFVHEHAAELQIDAKNYSLWGGSAGARMAAWLGSFGTENFGEKKYPRPAAVIMQYTGLSEVFGNEPPTYNCVGTHDGIANWRTMDARIKKIRANGTPAQPIAILTTNKADSTINVTNEGNIIIDGDLKTSKVTSKGDVSLTAYSGAIVNAVDTEINMTGAADKISAWKNAGLISERDSANSATNSAKEEKAVRLNALENLFKRWVLKDDGTVDETLYRQFVNNTADKTNLTDEQIDQLDFYQELKQL